MHISDASIFNLPHTYKPLELERGLMRQTRPLRLGIIAIVLVLGVFWALVSAKTPGQVQNYPNSGFLVSAAWLNQHLNDRGLIVVDVREKKHTANGYIPGAVHMEWKMFQESDPAREDTKRGRP